MNKAEQIFKSLFATEADYLQFKLTNKVIVDNHEAEDEETGEQYQVSFVRVVAKDNDKHHVVSDDKPSYVQYSPKHDVAVLNWIQGNATFKREGNKPVSIDINFDCDVEFTYEKELNNCESVLWEDLFPELSSIKHDPEGGMKTIYVATDRDNLDWEFLNRLSTI